MTAAAAGSVSSRGPFISTCNNDQNIVASQRRARTHARTRARPPSLLATDVVAPAYRNGVFACHQIVFYAPCVCECVCACACLSRVQYLLPGCSARGAVCCLNKGSQSAALKRTFIKRLRGSHLFPAATAGRQAGRPGRRRPIALSSARQNCSSEVLIYLFIPRLN